MRIAVLDGYGVNPGDISWSPIEQLGEVTVYPRFEPGAPGFTAVSENVEALLVDAVPFDAERFAGFPNLRYLGLFSTGHNHIDLAAAAARGVAVTNVPGYSEASVAQLAIGLLLSVAHRVTDYDQFVHNGRWRRDVRFAYIPGMPIELAGKSIAVIGFGAIGTAVARIAGTLGMRIYGWADREKHVDGVEIRWLPWRRLLAESDVVSLHLPLTAETYHLIDDDAVRTMKRGSILINTARGALLDDHAVAEALHTEHLAGVGVDVLGEEEPPAPTNPLLSAPRCVITPHVGWATREARSRCIAEAAKNLAAYLAGERRNRLT